MIVVPVAAIAERRVADHYRKAGATSPAAAIDFEPTRFVRKRAQSRLRDGGVLKPAGAGWYLDDEAWTERHAARRKRAAVITGVAAVIAAAIAVF